MANVLNDFNNRNNFSAFRLFYNEFIYKENVMINYSKIRRYIVSIRNLSLEMRHVYKGNKELYNIKLERINSRIKKLLYNIQLLEPYLFEVYYIIYKNKVSIGSDSVKEMPFVISCSFYEDYRLNSKNNEDGKYGIIPRFTSEDKRRIRGLATKLGEIKYFKELLAECNVNGRYEGLLNRLKYVLEIEPLYNENHYQFLTRTEKEKLSLERMIKRYLVKATGSDDYDYITETLDVAFKKDYSDWSSNIIKALNVYFQDVYEKSKNSKSLLFEEFVANDMSYDTFVEFGREIEAEKKELDELWKSGKNIKLNFNDNSYCASFRKKVIEDFYDERLKFLLDENSSINDFAMKGLEIYRLATDLQMRIFEKTLFDASHSLELKRNNDVRSAILKKIYNLYNPNDLHGKYESLKMKFDKLLKEKGESFSKNVVVSLNELKRKEGFKGELPTNLEIKKNVITMKKDFILKNYYENLLSRDIENFYDTRDYDFKVMALEIPVNEMANLYFLIKREIKVFDNDERKEQYFQSLLDFVANDILNKIDVKYDKNDKVAYDAILADVAREYLFEEIKIDSQKDEKDKSINKNVLKANYDISKEEFYQNSEFYKLNLMVNNLLKERKQ